MRTVIGSIEDEYKRYKALGEGAMQQLSESQLCESPPGSGNSVEMIVWHISGNFRSRFTDFLTTDGEKPGRNRESEFAARSVSREELMRIWNEGWEVLFGALSGLDDGHLSQRVVIRWQSLSVLAALHRSLTHVSYQIGQLVFLAKMLKGSDWHYLSIPPGQSEKYNRDSIGGNLAGQT
jgi:hypothetical protein